MLYIYISKYIYLICRCVYINKMYIYAYFYTFLYNFIYYIYKQMHVKGEIDICMCKFVYFYIRSLLAKRKEGADQLVSKNGNRPITKQWENTLGTKQPGTAAAVCGGDGAPAVPYVPSTPSDMPGSAPATSTPSCALSSSAWWLFPQANLCSGRSPWQLWTAKETPPLFSHLNKIS